MTIQRIETIVPELQQQKSPTSLCKHSTKLTNRYGDKEKFLIAFNPEKQNLSMVDISKSVNGDYPTLAELDREYGKGMSKAWLIPQLFNLCQYCGVKDKLDTMQYTELANIINTEHYFLKVTELMVFFQKFKAGHYGRFYGNIDPLVIVTSLNEFIKFRNAEILKFEQAEKERRKAEHDAKFPPISYEEYKRSNGR